MKKVTSVKDEWVAAAMTDDQMVIELLLRLKQAGTTTVSENLLPLQWGIRQRRSRPSRFCGVRVTSKKDVVSATRGSPKTPLSWSDGSGGSGGGDSASPPSSAVAADGFEEDVIRQASCSTSTGSRSKAFPTNVITSSISTRLKRKKLKSSSELKYEENLKLKDRLELQKEIASLRATLDEQNVRNQRLKRIKLELNSGRVKNGTPVDLFGKSQGESSCRVEGNQTASSENQESFFIPDLNMAPSEEYEILHGTS